MMRSVEMASFAWRSRTPRSARCLPRPSRTVRFVLANLERPEDAELHRTAFREDEPTVPPA